MANLRTMCRTCNSAKGAVVPAEMREQPDVILCVQSRLQKCRCIHHNTRMSGASMVERENGDVFREVRCSRCEFRAWVDNNGKVHEATEPFEPAHLRYEIPRTEIRLRDMHERAARLGLTFGDK